MRPILAALLRSKTAPLLVAMQVAVSLAILANSLYVVHLRQAAAERPSGVADEADVFYLTVRPVVKITHNENVAQQQVDVKALAAVPGVVSAAWVSQMPMSRSGSSSGFSLDRRQARESIELALYYSPDALVKTLGLKLVDGRDLAPDDVVEVDPDVDEPTAKFPKAILLTRPVAERLYPGTRAVGKTLLYGLGDQAVEMRVVGVVERLQTPPAPITPDVDHSAILPMRSSANFTRLAVRTEPGQRDRVMAEAEATLRKVPALPRVIKTRTVEGDRFERYRNERSFAWMLIAVSILLLLVTASGIVGMTVLRVAQRRKQIGIRRALGARRGHIVRHFLVENLIITTAGVLAGVVLAIALNHTLMAQVELSRLPAGYLVAGMVTLWLLGIAAVCGPAWRAAGIPPATATRSV
jgi:putative ABC transport system permease protein